MFISVVPTSAFSVTAKRQLKYISTEAVSLEASQFLFNLEQSKQNVENFRIFTH